MPGKQEQHLKPPVRVRWTNLHWDRSVLVRERARVAVRSSGVDRTSFGVKRRGAKCILALAWRIPTLSARPWFDAVVQQLPPMRRLNSCWRTRPRRLKAVYYVACVVVIVVGGRHGHRRCPRQGRQNRRTDDTAVFPRGTSDDGRATVLRLAITRRRCGTQHGPRADAEPRRRRR